MCIIYTMLTIKDDQKQRKKKSMKKSSTLEHELIQLINIYMHEVCNNFVCKSRSLTLQYMKLNSYIVKFSTFQGENIIVYRLMLKTKLVSIRH